MTQFKFSEKILMSAPHMSGEEIKYINKAFEDNFIVPLGPNVNQFEQDMIHYLGGDIYAVAMTSGTAAIHIALRLLNVIQGEEIFCSSATFMATANPILYEKAIPVFIDSEINTFNICPKSLELAIESKIKAGKKVPRILIIADLFGMSADYDNVLKICDKYNIILIEDAAEALGSTYKNKKCGVFGKFGILSFNGNKIITTSGGGMLITHSKEEAQKALFLITQARDNAPYYLHSEIGYNYRLSNVCAGIGIGQMSVIDQRVSQRRNHYKTYKENLKGTSLIFMDEPNGYFSNRWLTTPLIDPKSNITPTKLLEVLANSNVEARHIWKPMHTQPIFKNNEFFKIEERSISDKIFEEGICLPSGSNLSEDTIVKICEIIKSVF